MNVIRSCDKNETLMFICAFWNNWINSTSIPQILAHFVTKSLDQVLFSDIIMEVSNIHVFNLPFPVYAFVVILLVVALLYCVVVFAYDCCDAAVVYHPVNGDRLWYSRLLSGLSCIIIGGECWWRRSGNTTGLLLLAFYTFWISFCNFWFIFWNFNIYEDGLSLV